MKRGPEVRERETEREREITLTLQGRERPTERLTRGVKGART